MTNEKHTDCMACRMISGTGLIGSAAYIAIQSKKTSSKYGRTFMLAVSLGFAFVGSARILNIYPFNTTHRDIDNMSISQKKMDC